MTRHNYQLENGFELALSGSSPLLSVFSISHEWYLCEYKFDVVLVPNLQIIENLRRLDTYHIYCEQQYLLN